MLQEDENIFLLPAAAVKEEFLQRDGLPIGKPSRAQGAEAAGAGAVGPTRRAGYSQWMQETGQESIASWIFSSGAPVGS